MRISIMLPIALAIAGSAMGHTIQVRPTNLSALTGEHVSTVILECAVIGGSLLAGEIVLGVESNVLEISTATGGQAFASAHEARQGSEYWFEASQSLASLNPSLGSDGEPVPFATIELEILTDGPFESGIGVSGMVTQIGGQPTPATMEFVGEQPDGGGVITSDDGKRLFIPIRRIAPEPPPSTEIPLDQWTTETAPLTLTIQPTGGDAAVTTLTAGNAYELHYGAGQNQISNYILFFAGADASHSISEVARPGSGDWSDTGFFSADFAAINASAEGGLPDGFQRNAQVFDMHPPGADRAASTGQLLNFTPQTAGPLGIELYMQMIDPERGRSIEMQKSLVLDVQSGD